MSSGSYFPPPVRAVEIPKPHGGGTRILDVPTVADRIAQTVVATRLERELEPKFHPDSYGYRPGRSAEDWWRRSGTGWKRSGYVCIPTKPGSSTARTRTGAARMPEGDFFLHLRFSHKSSIKDHGCLGDGTRQKMPVGAKGDFNVSVPQLFGYVGDREAVG
nr:reverse transcriptase domain-containing protein [Streptantibioticus ferralitis]